MKNMNRINFTFNAENFMKIKKEITLSLTIIFFFYYEIYREIY